MEGGPAVFQTSSAYSLKLPELAAEIIARAGEELARVIERGRRIGDMVRDARRIAWQRAEKARSDARTAEWVQTPEPMRSPSMRPYARRIEERHAREVSALDRIIAAGLAARGIAPGT
jgi:hypothetical protein